jgi:hypothetical protein
MTPFAFSQRATATQHKEVEGLEVAMESGMQLDE